MNIAALGLLKPDKNIPEWIVSSPIEIPYFDGQELTFTLDTPNDEDTEAIEEAVRSFLALGPKDRFAASPHVFRNYHRMLEAVDQEYPSCSITSADEVWSHVHPTEVFISKRGRRDDIIYIQITAECDWEIEHGLQIIYRDGSVLSRVSDQDGHLTYTDAYDLPEEQDKIDG
jgi:hypothetical protein